MDRRAETWSERHRLGGALLRRVPNDSAIWSELFEHAKNAVRFAGSVYEPTPEFAQWCAEHQLPVENYYWDMAFDSFTNAAEDPRARPLLLEALQTDESSLIFHAICALGQQHEESSLPAIEKTLQRVKDDVNMLASALSCFASEHADALAMKYLDEDQQSDYLAARNTTQEWSEKSPSRATPP